MGSEAAGRRGGGGILPDLPLWRDERWRGTRTLLLLVLAGLGLLLAARPAAGPAPAPEVRPPGGEEELTRLERETEERLAGVLSAVAGAGRVRVSVALAGTPERRYASDRVRQRTVTRESEQGGRGRTSEQVEESERVVQAGSAGPALAGTRRPEVMGVLVVAPGAGDPAVRLRLAEAVEAALDVPLARVVVLAGEPGQGGEPR